MFLSEPPPTEPAQQLYQEDRDSDGYVNNLTHIWGWRPDVHEAFMQARSTLTEGSELSPADLALLNAATAAARSSSYCALAWGSRLADRVDLDTAARVLAGTAEGLDARSAAMVGWARRVAVEPGATTAADVGRLRAAGLDDRQIVEATILIALRVAYSAVNDALGAEPDAQLVDGSPARVRAMVTYGRPPSATPSS